MPILDLGSPFLPALTPSHLHHPPLQPCTILASLPPLQVQQTVGGCEPLTLVNPNTKQCQRPFSLLAPLIHPSPSPHLQEEDDHHSPSPGVEGALRSIVDGMCLGPQLHQAVQLW